MTSAIGVALPPDSQVARVLVDRAAEMAQRLSGRWVAFVICNDELPSDRAMNALRQAELAMRSGGTVMFCEGEDDVARTLLTLAARAQIDMMILGAPRRSGLLGRFRGSVIDRVVHAARSFDVVVIGNGHQP